MAAPAHYIRTIHTSFTAAHPHSSTAWANAASVRSQHHLHPFTSSINSHNSQIYQQHLQQQQHNHHHHHHQHQQHQQQLHYLQSKRSTTSTTGASPAPSPAGAGGRRRAGSIRMTPPSPSSPPPSYVRFDPFADEPLSAPPSSPSSHPNRMSSYNRHDYQQPPTSPSPPITIHIPAAAPTEVKRYSASQGRRIPNFGSSTSGGAGGGGNGSTFLGGSTIPTSAAPPALNPSKIVAGILLNRVHAVGKPMRRRLPLLSGPKQYVKSGLSSVVSVQV